MKLDVPLKTLGPVDHLALKNAVAAATQQEWLEEQLRQKSFDVHAKTHSIIMLFVEGWPEMTISRHSGWNTYSRYALPVMQEIIRKHYSIHGTIIRAVFAKLLAGMSIDEHFDDHPTFSIGHRIHVPLVTNDEVDFVIAGEHFNLKEGIAYEVSNLDFHYVANPSHQDRVHMIFDYVEDAPAS
ncbi:MAG: aspartyl/asparaginyl beta-hydroxylase domain-containing protein [Parvularculaceae bacterium]|nr:aspartyl/asparaginyl beta-hydroxylase domain-containing protein [Parvularculaceae bacterium]